MNQGEHSANRMDTAVSGRSELNDGEVRLDDRGDPISTSSDIVFDCPHCAHQLVIDVRGAGLTVNCTECGEPVQVPIPEGMEVTDFDESAEQLFAQILQLRRSLARAEGRIAEFEQVVASLMERRSAMEKARLATLHRCAEVNNLLQSVLRSQGDIALVVQRMQVLLAEEQK